MEGRRSRPPRTPSPRGRTPSPRGRAPSPRRVSWGEGEPPEGGPLKEKPPKRKPPKRVPGIPEGETGISEGVPQVRVPVGESLAPSLSLPPTPLGASSNNAIAQKKKREREAQRQREREREAQREREREAQRERERESDESLAPSLSLPLTPLGASSKFLTGPKRGERAAQVIPVPVPLMTEGEVFEDWMGAVPGDHPAEKLKLEGGYKKRKSKKRKSKRKSKKRKSKKRKSKRKK